MFGITPRARYLLGEMTTIKGKKCQNIPSKTEHSLQNNDSQQALEEFPAGQSGPCYQ